MGKPPPPSGSPWPSEPRGPERPAAQTSPAWAWPPDSGSGAQPPSHVWAWPPPPQPRRRRSRVVGAPPGTPYHRLARTRRHRWWVPPLALVCALLLFFVLQVLVVNVAGLAALLAGFSIEGQGIFGAELPDFAVRLILVSMMIPAVLVATRFVQWRRVGTLLSVEGRLRGGWMLVCLAAAGAGLVTSVAFLYALNRTASPGEAFLGAFGGADTFAIAVVIIALFMPFQAAAEELALRGFLMQAVGSYGAEQGESWDDGPVRRLLRGPLPAVLISGGVFALLHSYDALGRADVAVFGIAIAWVTWYTGGIEAAIALHVLHNGFGMGLAAYQGTLSEAGTGTGAATGLLSTLIEVGVFAAIVVVMARRRGLHRVVPETGVRTGADTSPDTGADTAEAPAEPAGPQWAPARSEGTPPGEPPTGHRG